MARSDKSRIADGRQQVGLILDEDIVQRLDVIAKRDGRTRAQVMAMFIENGLAGDEQFSNVVGNEEDCLRIASMTSFTETDYYADFDEESQGIPSYSVIEESQQEEMDNIESLLTEGYGDITLEQLHLIRKEADFYCERHRRRYYRAELRREQMRLNAMRKAGDDVKISVEESEVEK